MVYTTLHSIMNDFCFGPLINIIKNVFSFEHIYMLSKIVKFLSINIAKPNITDRILGENEKYYSQ